MTTNKKYDFIIEEKKSLWTAKITRKVTSKKTTVTKQQDDFKTAEEATQWAEQTLLELSETLKKSNARHGAQRKNIEEVRRDRSNRRAEKTAEVKAEKAKEEALEASEEAENEEAKV